MQQAMWLHHSHHRDRAAYKIKATSRIYLETEFLAVFSITRFPTKINVLLHQQHLNFPIFSFLFNINRSVVNKKKINFYFRFHVFTYEWGRASFQIHSFFFLERTYLYSCPFFSFALPFEFLRTFINEEMFCHFHQFSVCVWAYLWHSCHTEIF